jgi:predicted TIM-barrel fold metal-dependent hydrolase
MQSMATSDLPDDGHAILDSHCHAWRRWPYAPRVPDEDGRATVEQLLYEMDQHGVAQAAVVCAAIENNPDNLDYVAEARERHPGRLHMIADLDCSWSDTYHLPGSADRLRAVLERYKIAGFAHYAAPHNDGWLRSDDADALFKLAAERRLIVSLGASPEWQADLREMARRHPSVPVLCQALGLVRGADGVDSEGMAEVLASAQVSNIYIKVSGLHYCATQGWDYPWPEVVALLARIFDAYGSRRLCWGSDFPASTRFCTFRQSLEVVRAHCPFFTPADLQLVLGGTLRSMLASGQAGG